MQGGGDRLEACSEARGGLEVPRPGREELRTSGGGLSVGIGDRCAASGARGLRFWCNVLGIVWP